MSSTMIESGVLDSSEWPSLGGPTLSSNDQKESDWELLHPTTDIPTPTPSCQRAQTYSNVVVVDVNPKLLRHSASSPDLRRYMRDIEEEEEADGDERTDGEASSFAMISGPASVVSLSSSGFSFRDAIMSKSEQPTSSDYLVAPRSEPRKPRVNPRFVVKPIRRCTQSMGDLRSLAEDEEVLGDADAKEFYQRKAMGAKGRANGLKIRPDEMKRKQFTLQKKEMQRQGQR
jgi:hypothetical protein